MKHKNRQPAGKVQLPAPQPAKSKVDRTKARNALLAALSSAGATTFLVASLSGQVANPAPMRNLSVAGGMTAPTPLTQPASQPATAPVLVPDNKPGGVGVNRLAPAAELAGQPATAPALAPKMLRGDVAVGQLVVPATEPATQPTTAPVLAPQRLGGEPTVSRIVSPANPALKAQVLSGQDRIEKLAPAAPAAVPASQPTTAPAVEPVLQIKQLSGKPAAGRIILPAIQGPADSPAREAPNATEDAPPAATQPATQPATAPAASEKEVAALVAQLDSEKYAERANAFKKLKGFGMSIAPQLRQLQNKYKDNAEVSESLKSLIQAGEATTQPAPAPTLQPINVKGGMGAAYRINRGSEA